MNLYEINEQIKNCVILNDAEAVDVETGEIIDIESLKALEMQRDQKIENVALWIKNLNDDVESLKVEKNKLAAREKAAKDKAESLKAFLSDFLAGEKFQTPRVVISWRKSKAVEFDNSFILDIPAEYLRFKEPELNKAEVKKALEEGKEIIGCQLVESQNIQIK